MMKTEKSKITKALIIEKAAPLFNIKGYAGTSMNDLLSETGLSKGCVYGHFQNKDDIALAAFEYNHQLVNEHFKERILARECAIERLLIYPQTYRNYLDYPFMVAGCPILNAAVEVDDTHPVLQERVAGALLFWKGALMKQIKRGIERGEIKAGTDPNEFAVIMISLIEGALMQAKLTQKTKDLNLAMDFLEKLITQLRPE